MDIETVAPSNQKPGGRWVIRTPLRNPYGKMRKAKGGYKGGFASALLPHLCRVAPCSEPQFSSVSITNVMRSPHSLVPEIRAPSPPHPEESSQQPPADPWQQLTRDIEAKAAARGLRVSPSQPQRAAGTLDAFRTYYGLSAMAEVEKKLRTEWGSGGFSPRFLEPGSQARRAL